MSLHIAIVTAFWQRPVVSMLYWQGITRLRKTAAKAGHQLSVVSCISAEDVDNTMLARIYQASCIVHAPNQPLAAKLNVAVKGARVLNPDYVMNLGSDDLISDGLFLGMVQAMEAGIPHAGITDIYFWDMLSGRATYWSGYQVGYRVGRSVGVARFYSRCVLETLDWMVWPESERSRGMDGISDERLIGHGIPLLAQPMRDWKGVAVDVKSWTNIWPFYKYDREPVDAAILVDDLPELSAILVTHESND